MVSARCLYSAYLVLDSIKLSVLYPAEVYYHVDLICAVFDGIRCLKAFCRSGVVSERKADNGAYVELALGIVVSESDIRRGNAHRCGVVFHTVVANGLYLLLGGSGCEKGVVGIFQNIILVHFKTFLILFHIYDITT